MRGELAGNKYWHREANRLLEENLRLKKQMASTIRIRCAGNLSKSPKTWLAIRPEGWVRVTKGKVESGDKTWCARLSPPAFTSAFKSEIGMPIRELLCVIRKVKP